jgi:hypothetical protein
MTVDALVALRARLLDKYRPGWYADQKPDALMKLTIGMWPYTSDCDMTDQQYAFADLCDSDADDAWRQEVGRRKQRMAIDERPHRRFSEASL